jgi:hypothetical protein
MTLPFCVVTSHGLIQYGQYVSAKHTVSILRTEDGISTYTSTRDQNPEQQSFYRRENLESHVYSCFFVSSKLMFSNLFLFPVTTQLSSKFWVRIWTFMATEWNKVLLGHQTCENGFKGLRFYFTFTYSYRTTRTKRNPRLAWEIFKIESKQMTDICFIKFGNTSYNALCCNWWLL